MIGYFCQDFFFFGAVVRDRSHIRCLGLLISSVAGLVGDPEAVPDDGPSILLTCRCRSALGVCPPVLGLGLLTAAPTFEPVDFVGLERETFENERGKDDDEHDDDNVDGECDIAAAVAGRLPPFSRIVPAALPSANAILSRCAEAQALAAAMRALRVSILSLSGWSSADDAAARDSASAVAVSRASADRTNAMETAAATSGVSLGPPGPWVPL